MVIGQNLIKIKLMLNEEMEYYTEEGTSSVNNGSES